MLFYLNNELFFDIQSDLFIVFVRRYSIPDILATASFQILKVTVSL